MRFSKLSNESKLVIKRNYVAYSSCDKAKQSTIYKLDELKLHFVQINFYQLDH